MSARFAGLKSHAAACASARLGAAVPPNGVHVELQDTNKQFLAALSQTSPILLFPFSPVLLLSSLLPLPSSLAEVETP